METTQGKGVNQRRAHSCLCPHIWPLVLTAAYCGFWNTATTRFYVGGMLTCPWRDPTTPTGCHHAHNWHHRGQMQTRFCNTLGGKTNAPDLCDAIKKKKSVFSLNCAMFVWSVFKCWNKATISHARTHAFKSQTFCKGSGCLKGDPAAGYYGMPGICWRNIAQLVWACWAWSVWIVLFHSPFSLTSVKRFNRMERSGGGWWVGGSRTRGECAGQLQRDSLCLSTLLREG